MNILEQIEQEKIIVIIRGVEKKKILPLVNALYEGGIRFVEVTFPQGEDDSITYENIKTIVENFKGKMHVGSGTVLTEEQVELTKKAGGEFIISPDTCEKVIKKTKESGMISMPGAYTPSEITTAVRCGADFVKLFPASTLGTSYIKAIRAPLKNVKLLAVGGVNLDNVKDFIKVGVVGFGIGANVVDKTMLQNEDYNGIKELAKKYVESVK